MRISDWSSDVCSSDLFRDRFDQLSVLRGGEGDEANVAQISRRAEEDVELLQRLLRAKGYYSARVTSEILPGNAGARLQVVLDAEPGAQRSEEHTSELQSLMRISYAVFCLHKKK